MYDRAARDRARRRLTAPAPPPPPDTACRVPTADSARRADEGGVAPAGVRRGCSSPPSSPTRSSSTATCSSQQRVAVFRDQYTILLAIDHVVRAALAVRLAAAVDAVSGARQTARRRSAERRLLPVQLGSCACCRGRSATTPRCRCITCGRRRGCTRCSATAPSRARGGVRRRAVRLRRPVRRPSTT